MDGVQVSGSGVRSDARGASVKLTAASFECAVVACMYRPYDPAAASCTSFAMAAAVAVTAAAWLRVLVHSERMMWAAVSAGR